MFFSIIAAADRPPAIGITIPIQKNSEPISRNPQSCAISPYIRIGEGDEDEAEGQGPARRHPVVLGDGRESVFRRRAVHDVLGEGERPRGSFRMRAA